jgi:hypothetical protein
MGIYDFTEEVPKTEDSKDFDELENWDEKLAKEENKICCHDCRYFDRVIFSPCSLFVGKYHKPCKEMKWW